MNRRASFRCDAHADERGWFSELARASALPKPIRQANLAFSKQGVIRGLHFHERGQDDLFVCLQGMVRVVVLDRETGDTFTATSATRTQSPSTSRVTTPTATRHSPMPLLLPRHRGVRPRRPRRAGHPLERPSGRRPLEHAIAASLRAGQGRGALITGAGGQLGAALAERYPEAAALAREQWDVRFPLDAARGPRARPARGCVDGRRRRRGRPAGRGCRQRRRHAPRRRARRTARLLLDRLRLRRAQGRAVRRVRRSRSALRVRPHQAPRRGGGRRRGVDRPVLLALRADGPQLRAHDAAARRRAPRGRRRRRPARLPDLRRAPRSRDGRGRRASLRRLSRRRGRATARGRSSPRRSSKRPASTPR